MNSNISIIIINQYIVKIIFIYQTNTTSITIINKYNKYKNVFTEAVIKQLKIFTKATSLSQISVLA